jgi:hypothetical protein
MKILAPCTHCDGKGKVELDGPLLECFEALKRIGPAGASRIHKEQKLEGMHVTATYQRLRRLEALGLVKETYGTWECC